MASITFGSIVAEAKGSVGLVTYSRNQFGAYAKARSTPTNPNTGPQTVTRGFMTTAVAAWKTLTDAQRLNYITFADQYYSKNRIGARGVMTGYNLFIRHSIMRTMNGQPTPTSPQPPTIRSNSKISSITPSAAAFVIQLTNGGFVPNQQVKLYATYPRAASRMSFNPSTRRWIGNYLPPAVPTNNNVTVVLTSTFGALPPFIGMKMSIGFCDQNYATAEEHTILYQTVTIIA